MTLQENLAYIIDALHAVRLAVRHGATGPEAAARITDIANMMRAAGQNQSPQSSLMIAIADALQDSLINRDPRE